MDDWLAVLLAEVLTEWLTNSLSDWLTDPLTVWLERPNWLTEVSGCLAAWLTDWLMDWSTHWLDRRNWLAGWLTDWLTALLTPWLINWPAGWLAYHSIHRFFYISISPMLWTFLHNTLRCPHTVDILQTCRNTLPGEKCTLSLTWTNSWQVNSQKQDRVYNCRVNIEDDE